MAKKPDTTSIPPDTGEIDTDWSEASLQQSAGGSGIPTAVLPEPYERYAKQVTSQPMGEETRKALSAPRLPAIDESVLDEFLEQHSRDSGEMRAMGLVGRQLSGPYAIPLELNDEGEPVRASERAMESPSELLSDSGAVRTTPVPSSKDWTAESPTPHKPVPEVLEAFRRASALEPAGSDNDLVGREEYFELDEPGEIGMEDSLEINLDEVVPLPFDLSQALQVDRKPTPRPEPIDPIEFPLENDGGALDLVSARATPFVPQPTDPIIDLRDRFAVGDFTGAHAVAEAILAEQPNNTEALRFRESCRDVLTQMYTARLGPLSGIPKLAIPVVELQWLSLDHRTGFLLSCVDGQSTIEEILDVSGMPTLDALRILFTLLQQQVIEIVNR